MDGYDIQKKVIDMETLFNTQIKINEEISVITEEISNLPEIPVSIDRWIDSLSNIDEFNFQLKDFNKLFFINKKYNNLIEQRESNSLKIKILVIDNLLDRIKGILEDE